MCPNHIESWRLWFRRVCPVCRSMLAMEVRGLDARDRVGWVGAWFSSGITSTIAEPEGATKSPLCGRGETLSAAPPAWLPRRQRAECYHCHVPPAPVTLFLVYTHPKKNYLLVKCAHQNWSWSWSYWEPCSLTWGVKFFYLFLNEKTSSFYFCLLHFCFKTCNSWNYHPVCCHKGHWPLSQVSGKNPRQALATPSDRGVL